MKRERKTKGMPEHSFRIHYPGKGKRKSKLCGDLGIAKRVTQFNTLFELLYGTILSGVVISFAVYESDYGKRAWFKLRMVDGVVFIEPEEYPSYDRYLDKTLRRVKRFLTKRGHQCNLVRLSIDQPE